MSTTRRHARGLHVPVVNEWSGLVRPGRAACKKTAMGRNNAADPDSRATLSDERHTYGII